MERYDKKKLKNVEAYRKCVEQKGENKNTEQ